MVNAFFAALVAQMVSAPAYASNHVSELEATNRAPNKRRTTPPPKKAVRGQPHPTPATGRRSSPQRAPSTTRPRTATPRTAAPRTAAPRTAAPRTAPRRAVRAAPPSTRRPNAIRHQAVRRPVYRRVTPFHGVWVYGPPVQYHHYYAGPQVPVRRAHLPHRAVDRNNTLAVGLKGGSFFSSNAPGAGIYSDLGLGVMARYRPVEALGLQVDLSHHIGDQGQRQQTQGAASIGLFAFPWTRVSPYVLGGVTLNSPSLVSVSDTGLSVQEQGFQPGLHGGLGLHFGIGQHVGLEFEARYIGYLARNQDDPVGALQGTGGLTFHF